MGGDYDETIDVRGHEYIGGARNDDHEHVDDEDYREGCPSRTAEEI
jgi:hypothetical protein